MFDDVIEVFGGQGRRFPVDLIADAIILLIEPDREPTSSTETPLSSDSQTTPKYSHRSVLVNHTP